MMNALARLFVSYFCTPLLINTPAGIVDARRRYWPPHRPVGSVRRGRGRPRKNAGGGLAVVNGRLEAAPLRPALSGARGLR